MLKLYVLIRDDLTVAQQAVQAGHAVAKFAQDWPYEFEQWRKDNDTLIYLSVTHTEFEKFKTVLADGEFAHSVFNEPDFLQTKWIDGLPFAQVVPADTAIAVAPNWWSQYVLFKDLPLAFQDPETKRKWWKWG